jgi:predicted transcriptional regulator
MDWSKVITHNGLQLTASEFLQKNYKKILIREMGNILGISESAVSRGMKKLDLVKVQNKNYIEKNNTHLNERGHYNWEYLLECDGIKLSRLNILDKYWKTHSNAKLSVMVDLPETAVKGKLERLRYLKSSLSPQERKATECFKQKNEPKIDYDWIKEVVYDGKSYSRQSLIELFYKTLNDVHLATIIGCSESNVFKKRMSMGLKKPKGFIQSRVKRKRGVISSYKPRIKINQKGVVFKNHMNKIISYDGENYKVSDFITEFYQQMTMAQIESIVHVGRNNISKFVKDNNLLKKTQKIEDLSRDEIIFRNKSRVRELYNVGNGVDMICVVTGLKEHEVIELLPYVCDGEIRKLIPPNNTVAGGRKLTHESSLTLKRYNTNSLVGSYL